MSSVETQSLSVQDRLKSQNYFNIFISAFQSLNINIKIDQSFKKSGSQIECTLVVSKQGQSWLVGKGKAKTQTEAKNDAAKKAINMFMENNHPIRIKTDEKTLTSSSSSAPKIDTDTPLPPYMEEVRNKIRALINGEANSETLIAKLASLSLECDKRNFNSSPSGHRRVTETELQEKVLHDPSSRRSEDYASVATEESIFTSVDIDSSSNRIDDNFLDVPLPEDVVEEVLLKWDFISFMHLLNAFKKYSVDIAQVYISDGAIVQCWLTVSRDGQTWILGKGEGRTAEKARCNAARNAVKMFLENRFPVAKKKMDEEKGNGLPDYIIKVRAHLFKLADPIYQKLKEMNEIYASPVISPQAKSRERVRTNINETVEKNCGSAGSSIPDEVAKSLPGDKAEGYPQHPSDNPLESQKVGRSHKSKAKNSSQIKSSITTSQQKLMAALVPQNSMTAVGLQANLMEAVKPQTSASNIDQLQKYLEETNQPREVSCGNDSVVQSQTYNQPNTESVEKLRVKRLCTDFSELIEDLILYRESYEAMRNPYYFLIESFSLCRIDFRCDSKRMKSGYETSLIIAVGEEDLILGTDTGPTKSKSEKIVSKKILEELLKSCYTVVAKKKVASIGVICLSSLIDPFSDNIASSSHFSSQASGEGTVDNISSVVPDWKIEVSYTFRRNVEELLENMVQLIQSEEFSHDLVFSSELSEQQTNYIDSVIKEKEKFHVLASEIIDRANQRNIIVSEAKNLKRIFKRVSAKGGSTEKFALFDPGSLTLTSLKSIKLID